MRKSGNPQIASAAVRHQNSAPEIRFSRYAAEKRIMLGMLVLPDVGPGGTLCARMSVVGEKNLVLYLYFGAKEAAGAGWAGDSGASGPRDLLHGGLLALWGAGSVARATLPWVPACLMDTDTDRCVYVDAIHCIVRVSHMYRACIGKHYACIELSDT